MKNYKDEIQKELDRIISEQRELAKKETEKLLSERRNDIKKTISANSDNKHFKYNSKSSFFKILILIIIGFVIISIVLYFYYDSNYFKVRSNKEQTIEHIEKLNSINKIDSLKKELSLLYSNKDCFNSLLTAELSGKKVSLPCGTSSGKKGAGKRTEFLLETIANINVQIDSLKKLINIEKNKDIKDK